MSSPSSHLESRWPHRLAVLLVCATFPLIWVGGLVTTYDAGMAVPDWPGTYGYNLFLYPWQTWFFGPFDLFIEHGHRLLGSVVGLIAIALVVAVFRCDSRPWMRYAALAALALVVFQGALGGARVLFDERQLALVHGCVGPAFFAFAISLAVVTSQLWKSDAGRPFWAVVPTNMTARKDRPTKQVQSRSVPATLHILSGATTLLAFGQLLLGANLRHLSIATSPGFFRAVLLFHLFIAALLVLHVVSLAVVALRKHWSEAALVRPALGLCLLLASQLALGLGTWVVKYGWPEWFAGLGFAARYTVEADGLIQAYTVTAHVAIGSLILGTSAMLSLRAWRLVPFVTTSDAKKDSRGRWLFFGRGSFQLNTGRPKTQPRPLAGGPSIRPAFVVGPPAADSRPNHKGVGSRFSAGAYSVGRNKDRKRLADPSSGGVA